MTRLLPFPFLSLGLLILWLLLNQTASLGQVSSVACLRSSAGGSSIPWSYQERAFAARVSSSDCWGLYQWISCVRTSQLARSFSALEGDSERLGS